MEEEMAMRALQEAKSKLEKKYHLPISVQAFRLAVNRDLTLEKGTEIMDGACKLVLEKFRNCAYEIEFNEKAYELRRALFELIELHRDNHRDSQLWVARLRSERDAASIYMGDFLREWDFGFNQFLDERTPKTIKLYALDIASRYCPVLDKSISKESSDLPRKMAGNIVWYLDDVQEQLVRRFRSLLTVEARHVAEVLSVQTDVPLTHILPSINNQKKKAIYKIKQRVVNQDHVIHEIFETLTCERPSTKRRRPRASFLLLGPSGFGKTEIAKAVARHWYCDASRLVEIDMAEYAVKSTTTSCDQLERSKGMVRVFWNRLNEVVAKRPYSVIILDNIDKASPIVVRVLVEVLSYGALSDTERNIVDFSESIIFMTSSVGSNKLPPPLYCVCCTQYEDVLEQLRRNPVEFCWGLHVRERVVAEARRTFSAELLNSLDKILVMGRFHHKKAVARLLLREIVRDIYGERFVVHASNAAIDALFLKAPTLHHEGGKAFRKALLEHVIPQLSAAKGSENAFVCVDTLVGTYELSFRFQEHGQNASDWYLKLTDGTFDNLLVGLKKKVEAVYKIFIFRSECLRVLLSRHCLSLLGNLLANACNSLLKSSLEDKPLTYVFNERAYNNCLPTDEEKKKFKNLSRKLRKNDNGIARATSVILDALVKMSDEDSLELPNLPPAKHFLFVGLNNDAKAGMISSLNKSLGKSFFIYIKLDDNCRGEEVKNFLIDQVKQRPRSVVVILFDGVEFADDVLYKSLLEILDKGILDNSVDFRRSIVVLLSEVDNKRGIAAAMFNHPTNVITSSIAVKQSVKRFRTELLHRVDGLMIFDPLEENGVLPFLRIHISDLSLYRRSNYKLLLPEFHFVMFEAQ